MKVQFVQIASLKISIFQTQADNINHYIAPPNGRKNGAGEPNLPLYFL